MHHENHVRKGLAPDPQRFLIPVELDRVRVLAFDNRATFRIYQRYGAAFWLELFEHDPADELGSRLRLKSQDAFEFFLWVGLQRDADEAGETLTLEQVQEFILPTTINDLAAALLVALSATRTRPEKHQRGNAPAGAAAALVN
jgi:hypothetical protein